MYDLIIAGAGPAGISAAIYASRAGLDFIIIEENIAGGQIVNTYEIDNYPGLPQISGMELAVKMEEHAQRLCGDSFVEGSIDRSRRTEYAESRFCTKKEDLYVVLQGDGPGGAALGR